MTREDRLEAELRRRVVLFWGNHYHCNVCTGRWELHEKVERHTPACVLRKNGDAVAEPPPEIPF